MKRIRYVTPLQKMICDLITDNPLRIYDIGNKLKRKPNVIAYTVKKLEKYEYIQRVKQTYIAGDFEFIECSNKELLANRKKQNKMHEKEIEVYTPDDSTLNSVRMLHNAGFKRKEIARQLKLSIPQVLWCFFVLNTETEIEIDNDIIVLNDELFLIYTLLKKPYITLDELARKTNLTNHKVVEKIMELESAGAAIIKVHKTHTEYFAKEKDVQKSGGKEEYEIEVKKDECKRDCTCQSDFGKCGV